jgi:RNA polymerase sigma-70 factor (ECF subfamily)
MASEEHLWLTDQQTHFGTTHWSVVMAAAEPESPHSTEALEKLCHGYWHPLYLYVRRRGYTLDDAKDLTQEFFARLLERNYLKSVDRGKGRFRSFLLGAINHFLANEWDKAKTLKRGGRVHFVSLDEEAPQGEEWLESIADLSAEKVFARRWALEVLDQAFRRLREECRQSNKGELFDQLKAFLTTEATGDEYAALAVRLGWTSGSVAVAVHRLRQRYRQLLREEVAQTVAGPEEVDDELRQVLSALSGD